MAYIKFDDMIGIQIDSETVCIECATEKELAGVEQKDILERNAELDDNGMTFCDRCEKSI